jgi:hypothetical protein
MFLVVVTRNKRRVSKWVCPFRTLRLVVNCLTLMTLKPKYSRLLAISSAGVSAEGDGLLPYNYYYS